MLDYDKFADSLKTELPINRKERFYTGTILPSILFHNGPGNLFTFLREIDGFPAGVTHDITGDDFLFYTEYNLKESAGGKSVGAVIPTGSNDTPDAIIEILKPQRLFVIVEAKMFSNISEEEFAGQVAAQKRAVNDILNEHYGLNEGQIFHIALVPEGLGLKSTTEYQVITWEFLLSDAMDLDQNYFANYLRFALKNYSDLVSSSSWGTASTVESNMTGLQICERHEAGEDFWVGRQGGAAKIREDAGNGKWKNFKYSINSQKPKDGRTGNWITISEFESIVGCSDRK